MESSFKKIIRAEAIQLKKWQLQRSDKKQGKKGKNTPPHFT